MVVVGFKNGLIFPEAFVAGVIILDIGRAGPIGTFDPEVIICFHGKGAVPVLAFKTSLGKRNTGRNTGFPHVFYCFILVHAKVLSTCQLCIGSRSVDCIKYKRRKKKQEQGQIEPFHMAN